MKTLNVEHSKHYARLLRAALLSIAVLLIAAGLGAQNPTTGTPIQITDVVGLTNALDLRPMVGVGYSTGRTAIINAEGQIDGASGTLSDCVFVDGTTGPCPGSANSGGSNGASSPNFADGETPAGAINGSNASFTLKNSPISGSAHVCVNGLRMTLGMDFTIAGNVITFSATSIPHAGAIIQVDYRYLSAAAASA